MAEECNLTYRLLDAATGDELDPMIFAIDLSGSTLPFIRGTVPSREPWLARSPLLLQIEAVVQEGGQIAVSPPLIINLFDPCTET